jgi:hypothetical protein
VTREFEYCLPFSAELKNIWSYASSTTYVLMALFLIEHGLSITVSLQAEGLIHNHKRKRGDERKKEGKKIQKKETCTRTADLVHKTLLIV